MSLKRKAEREEMDKTAEEMDKRPKTVSEAEWITNFTQYAEQYGVTTAINALVNGVTKAING